MLKKYFFIFVFIFYIFLFVFHAYFGSIMEKNIALEEIKNHEFKAIIVNKKKFKSIILTLNNKDSIFELSASFELTSIAEIGDSIYKKKNTNCCLIVKKNRKRENVKYVQHDNLPETLFVDCSKY